MSQETVVPDREIRLGRNEMWKPEWNAVREEITRLPDAAPAPAPTCALCNDEGVLFREVNGQRRVRDCECRREKQLRARLERSGIPRKYAEARLETFRTQGLDPSIYLAYTQVRGLAKTWPLPDSGKGLLLVGSCGVGKTHLAAALLAALVGQSGALGRFWDVGELLVQLKRGFAPASTMASGDSPVRSEGDLFEELKRVEVLVLDELGASRITDWSYDVVASMIGARYNSGRLTLVTSNYPNLGVGEGAMRGGVREETLGDRVGARIWSRLQDMTRSVEMVGADYRRKKA